MTEQSPETDTNMIWTIHGIIRRETFPPSASPPHRTIDVGELTALVSARPAPPMPDQPDLEAEAEFVLFHNKLLVSYAATSDVVPVRYGAYLMSKADVKIRVAEQAHVHQKILARIAGAQEYAVRIERSEVRASEPAERAPAPEPASGRSYLAARRTARDARETQVARSRLFLADTATALANCARETAIGSPGQDRLLDLNLLIDRDRIRPFLECAEAVHAEAAQQGMTLTVTGPWPAYAFSTPPSEDTA
ncbi:MAG: GvpL/GvpF family gas vesicle protein [Pseudomonadota bacterium]